MNASELLKALWDLKLIKRRGKSNVYFLLPEAHKLLTEELRRSGDVDKSPEDTYQELAGILRNLYPAGVISGNLSVKSPQRDVEKKLKQFFEYYKHYTPEQVKLATSAYVNECQRKNYAYMKTLSYFILKNQESTLAGWIERLELGDQTAEDQVKGDII